MELPCLAFQNGDQCSTALYTVSEKNLIVALDAGDKDEVLRNKTICPTARGLLLARDPDTMATFLWCPEDGDQVPLPPLDGLDDDTLMHSHCLLSDKPSAPGCVVLLVETGDDTFIWYCRPGDDVWVKRDYDIGSITLPYEYQGSNFYKLPICPIAACRGKFYFNSTAKELSVLEFCPDPVFSSITIDDSYDDEAGHENKERKGGPKPGKAVFLVESGDELYQVTLSYATLSYDEIHQGCGTGEAGAVAVEEAAGAQQPRPYHDELPSEDRTSSHPSATAPPWHRTGGRATVKGEQAAGWRVSGK